MAFRAGAGRIAVTDAADLITVFDSDEGLFSATDFVTGSITLPQRQATFNGGSSTHTPFNTDTDHALDTINAGADVVVGGFKVTTATPVGLATLGWFNACGSYLHYIDSNSTASRAGTGEHWHLKQIATYTFKAVSGDLLLNERVQLLAQPHLSLNTSITLLAVTLDYKLYCGRFV